MKERQGANPYSSKFISTLEKGENIVGQRNGLLDTAQSISSVGGDTPCGKGLSMKTPDVFTPLRLNGGGDTSHESQENMDSIEHLSMDILANDPCTSSSYHDSQYVSNESDSLFVVNQDDLLDTVWSISSPITESGDTPCGKGLLMKTPDVFTPLRLNGGGDTSHEWQENMENIEYQNNNIVFNDSSISFSSNRDSQHDSNENNHLPFANQDDSMSEQSRHSF